MRGPLFEVIIRGEFASRPPSFPHCLSLEMLLRSKRSLRRTHATALDPGVWPCNRDLGRSSRALGCGDGSRQAARTLAAMLAASSVEEARVQGAPGPEATAVEVAARAAGPARAARPGQAEAQPRARVATRSMLAAVRWSAFGSFRRPCFADRPSQPWPAVRRTPGQTTTRKPAP